MGGKFMIYEFPPESDPIRQGDIFMGLPRIEISLKEVVLAEEDGELVSTWAEICQKSDSVNIIVPVRAVSAIVVTQNCDALHSRDITLCEIRDFKEVERKSKDTTSPKSWKNLITQHARINQKWFYLPPGREIGFTNKMGVDFMTSIRVPREDLESLRNFRKGRLIPMAEEHFRERIAEFFRRYPYDEWYPLDPAEFTEYKKEYPDVEPFIWQKTP
jgi:hypothetical protein